MASPKETVRWVWLSHALSAATPGYRGGQALNITPASRIADGASSNSLRLALSNHAGTHVDAPLHFLENGASVDSYEPRDWIFTAPCLVDIGCVESVLLGSERILPHIPNRTATDLILIRTGMEAYRGEDRYWKSYPALGAEVAEALLGRAPALRAVGLDTISLTGFDFREEGRHAHRAFLSRGLRIFEDLALAPVTDARDLRQVVAMPLRIAGGDGGPCTVAACLSV